MPREFIPNIDDANAEITRLDGQLETLTQNATKASNDLKAANDLLNEANNQKTKAEGERDGFKRDLDKVSAENVDLRKQVDTLKGSATRTIAKSGTDPVVDSPTPSGEPKKEATGLTGLQRAIAGRQAQVAEAKGRVHV